MKPRCPHCARRFASWGLAKRHVKYCRFGRNPRKTLAERIHGYEPATRGSYPQSRKMR
jgi:hypothetical protein